MQPSPCRVCGNKIDAHSNAYDIDGEWTPNDGDASICFYCGTLSIFRGGEPVDPTEEERAVFLSDPNVYRVIALIKMEGDTSGEMH